MFGKSGGGGGGNRSGGALGCEHCLYDVVIILLPFWPPTIALMSSSRLSVGHSLVSFGGGARVACV